MNEQEREKQFVEKIRGFLDESAESLNPDMRLRLQEARFRALRAAEKRRAWFFSFPRWITVGGFATATVAILAFFFWFNAPSLEAPTKQVEDFEILTSKEQIDFYKDLDFFLWLDTKENGT
ncbi:MAG: DUF3619 family protein [Deltaproteobacteria bacterium]|nr:DUF3619 family protein [Deltaproteobacteria bacterium]